MTGSRSGLAFLGFATAVAGVAWIGSRYSSRDLRTRTWYSRLKKPPFNPRQAAFPVVWTILYALMAFSGWRTWRGDMSPARSRALRLWAMQLAANAEWTHLFFGRHQPKQALADIVLLESLLVVYIATAKDVDGAAAACFLPYAGWVAFAAVLNAEIVRRNPEAETKLPLAA